MYKCDEFYNKQTEGGLLYSDSMLAIDWGIPTAQAIVAEKDLLLPEIKNFESKFIF
jgi:dTDP-4-dehydrorhamnose 3,5-epimerase